MSLPVKMRILGLGCLLSLCLRGSAIRSAEVIESDICVYGGTSAGVAAAVQGRRMGKTAVIVEFGRHLGGLTCGGLGATEIVKKAGNGGIARGLHRLGAAQ